MKTFQHDDLLYFRFDGLPNGTLHHAVFSRRGGTSLAPFDSLNMSLAVADERDRVYANRRRAYGLFSEIISWKLRFFIPTDANGPAILAKVLERYPIARVGERAAA